MKKNSTSESNKLDASPSKVYAKKSLGQNFLNSPFYLKKIVDTAGDLTGKNILEIGPGKGALTEHLYNSGAKKIILIEKDRRLIENLQERFSKPFCKIIEADILEINLSEIGLQKSNYILIANIPYYITGMILRYVVGGAVPPNKAIIMVQKEVAERIIARDKKESLLSMSVKIIGEPKLVSVVPRGCFTPAPNVDSAILLIDNISKNTLEKIGEEKYFRILKAGFAHKRKLLINNLIEGEAFGKNTGKDALEKLFSSLNISVKARAEDITKEHWISLTSADIM